MFCEVVASGLWLAPGDSEEVAAALSQALRNCIERFVFIFFLDLENKFEHGYILTCYIEMYRALIGLSYLRFGDVFSKYQPSQSEESFRFVTLFVE